MRFMRALGIALSLLAGAVVVAQSFVVTSAQAEDDRKNKDDRK
jgi:hypothetical protein